MRRIIAEDMPYDWNPAWHWDIADLAGTYLNHPRHALFVAVDDAGGEVFGTAAVRAGGPKPPTHPEWLAARYDDETTAQLYRVFVVAEQWRRGAARALVEQARRWVAREGGYRTLYLHTNANMTGALPFWRSVEGVVEVYDARHLDEWGAVHFELPLTVTAR
jgi:GNAT superfamily N-acetyltransferase